MLFSVASMTKPITATAVLMLQDASKLSVDDPVEKYLPEFGRLRTAEGKPARVTLRHLLTHTSRMSEISPDKARRIKNLVGLIPLYVARPVQFEPGTKWVYCQSGINTAARIVEVVAGTPFDEFLDRRLFGPLGMRDTTFYLTKHPSRTWSHRRGLIRDDPAQQCATWATGDRTPRSIHVTTTTSVVEPTDLSTAVRSFAQDEPRGREPCPTAGDPMRARDWWRLPSPRCVGTRG
jgi:CubicO group peptidase (beta-lactamase class C family)